MRLSLLLLPVLLAAQQPDAKYAALANQLLLADAAGRETILNNQRDLVNHDLVVAINHLGAPYYDKRDSAGGMRVADLVCAVSTRINDADGLAMCSYTRGMFFSVDDRGDDTIAAYQDALTRWETIGDHASQSRALNQIAIVHSVRAEYALAQPYYERAMQQADLSGNRERVAQTSMNLGNILKAQGNYRDSIQAIQRSIDICRELKLDRDVARPLVSMAALYNYQRDFEMALKYANESLAIQEKFDFMELRATTYGNLALAHQGLRHVDEARQFYEKELDLAAKTNDRNSRVMALYNYGDLIREQGQYPAAIKNFEEALALAIQIERPSMATHSRLSLAQVATQESRWQDALVFCEAAAPDVERLHETLLVIRYGDTCGLAHLRLGQLAAAEASFRHAVEETEAGRLQLAGEQETAAIYMNDKTGPYLHMVETLVAEGKAEEALRYSEMGKGRVVLDILRAGRASLNRSMSAVEQREETSLRLRVAALGEELVRSSAKRPPEPDAVAKSRATLEQARLDLRALQNRLYVAHPELRRQRVDFDPLAGSDFAAVLSDPNAAMLEYALGDRKLYLFVVTREAGRARVTVHTIAIHEEQLQRDISRFREQIASRDLGYGAAARALYRCLIEPAAEELRGKKTLVIMPDSFLWQLPFQALQSAPQRHLMEDRAVFYSPSITVLREMRRGRTTSMASPMVLAVGAAKVADSEQEVLSLRDIYGSARTKIYRAAEADEQVIRREAPRYDVLHLAAHGVFEAAAPMASYITLARAGKPEAGLLEARDMMSLDLRAGLVVLSGCETGRGGVGNGEGLIGMSWAIFVAGSPATVASQWKVDAKSTSRMMVAFHSNLRKTQSASRALQQAALAVMRNPEYRHPFYWSAFTLLGKGF